MEKLKEELQAVSKSLKALAQKSEKMVKALDKLEKVQAKLKDKAEPKEAVAKKATAKEAAKVTAVDQVVTIIKKAKEAVDVATLVEKTGFEHKKIRNILNRAFKDGKINRAGRGAYVGE